jgi:hypothetical protein
MKSTCHPLHLDYKYNHQFLNWQPGKLTTTHQDQTGGITGWYFFISTFLFLCSNNTSK